MLTARTHLFRRVGAWTAAASILLTLASFSGCARKDVRERPEALAGSSPNGVYHIVERGQTLWRIAQVYQVPLERLVQINQIGEPDRIEIGTHLWIPGVLEPRPIPGNVTDAGTARFLWPVRGGRLISAFGVQRPSHRHTGLDIAAAAGEAVQAAADGTVRYAGSSMRGYGKTLIIDHGEGWSTLYAHNSTLIAREGQRVRRGELIARVGRSGNATTEHCHFEIRRGDVPINPTPLLSGMPRSPR